ncbi:DUF1842 domain-containing protein [Tenacibaculum sp. M341]|uniref:DUF1842 domain-containing protein n=1 Tax=Tenacibaculum sp. M341 TaxID=2530339 RepID=UPI00104FA4C9|nr:DUF1842 domain-containing protein [Tenacibaculum sp. M341]TCI94827.1 DUF1842 domain-containing protein [Tenacibaculum sp. M341]
MAVIKDTQTLIETTYLVKGVIGNVGMPGAPITHFSLVVSPEQQTVSGIVEITRAINSPSIKLNVAGNIRFTGYGNIKQIINLRGEYKISAPPPAIGSYLEDFSAYLDTDEQWNGNGGFTFGFQKIDNVPVKATN